jgi:signal transduction histidine kinase
MSSSLITEKTEQLRSTTQNAAAGLEKLLSDKDVTASSRATLDKVYLDAISASNKVSVWIVESDGRISYYSDIPNEAASQLIIEGSTFSMTSTHMIGLTDRKVGGVVTGTQNGLFNDPQKTWLTASYPLSSNGEYLIIHQSIDIQAQIFKSMSDGLAVPVFISFTIALLLFTLMTRSLIRPIRLLSDAATKVTNGDLTARIHIPEYEKESPVQFGITDELSAMVLTVNHMIERIEAQDNERKVFVSSIAHDLRTPLTSIKGFITAILDGTIPVDRYDHYLQIVNKEVDRIQTLANSMTEVSTLGRKGSFKMGPFDINMMIQATLTSLENSLNEKKLGVQLETYRDDNGKLMAHGEKEQIMRVVYNLITNAIKFTPENGDIAITTDYFVKDNLVTVVVEDSGPGVPPDQRMRIFESFYKIDQSRTNPGSGLGLYICMEILHAHDQTITVDSSPILGGARFKFTLDGVSKDE